MATGKLGIPEILSGQVNKHTTHNEALRVIDSQLNLIVEEVGLNAPPGSPTVGKSYVIGASPTGDWASKNNQLASWDGVAWTFLDPAGINSPGPGWAILDKTTNRYHRLNTSNTFVKTGLGLGLTGGVQVGDNTTDDGYGTLYADTSRANTLVIGSVGLTDETVKSFFTHASPSQQFYSTAGAVNERLWVNRYSGNTLTFGIATDAGASENSWLKVFRTAAVVTYVDVPTGSLGVGLSTLPDRKLHVVETGAVTNTVQNVARLSSYTTSTPAVGIGAGLEFEVQTDATTKIVGSSIEAVALSVTTSSEDFKLSLKTVSAGGTLTERAYAALGFVVGAATGGDQGIGAVNASSYFIDSVPFGSVGVNQTVTDETGNYVAGTIYQNTGDFPIQLAFVLQGQASAVGVATLEVESATPPTITVGKVGIQSSAGGADEFDTLSYIIPKDYYFRVTATNMTLVSVARTA